MNISMQVLGGFMAVLGCAAVAVAFIALNAATFGTAGLVVAGLGIASALLGVGLFATGTYRNRKKPEDEESSEHVAAPAAAY
jgi:membrane protein implicated in regulation of membrane protease activity